MTRPLQHPRWPEDQAGPEDQAVLEEEAEQTATWMENQAMLAGEGRARCITFPEADIALNRAAASICIAKYFNGLG